MAEKDGECCFSICPDFAYILCIYLDVIGQLICYLEPYDLRNMVILSFCAVFVAERYEAYICGCKK